MLNSEKVFEILNSYNKFWFSEKIEGGIRRDILEHCLRQIEGKEVIVISGVRRSGKSTLMAQMIQSLIRSGIRSLQILCVNLEEPLFSPDYSIFLLETIYRVYREKINPDSRCFLFLDEVQNIPEWEHWVRGRIETENLKVIVTGSSSQLLSREAGTKLTGRHLSFELCPLSLPEFLRFNGLEIRSEKEYLSQKAAVRMLFHEYLRYGGFPEIVLKKNAEDKKLLLKQYFEDILYRDIVTRQDVRDVYSLRNLAVYLLTNSGQMTSITKLKKNFEISQDKTENYFSAIIESGLISTVRKMSPSLKKSLRAGFKTYTIDTGLRNRVAFTFSEDLGRMAENVVFNHLKLRHETYYHSNGGEIDFIIKEGTKISRRIQVWYADPSETNIPSRETKPFAALFDKKSRPEDFLITNDLDISGKDSPYGIRCISMVKFLLNIYLPSTQ